MKDLLQQITTTGEKAFIENMFWLFLMYGASLASAFNFCDTFWKISSMCLLNFNLQLKVMRGSFSLRELLMRKAPISSVICYWLFKSR